MAIYGINKIRKSRGFTMIELMLVMAIAAVMMSLKMQDDKLEMTQLQSRKLGATELFVYNLGVQKHISKMAGEVPAPGDYPKVYTGVDWLKNDQCFDPALPKTDDNVPCSFLRNTGGRTSMGAMSFTTTIDYDSSSGYTARTVLSQMAGTGAGENNSGVLGMAALVASGAFIGSDASATSGGSGGSIIYCPDLNPMPAGMLATCGLERDQIVMIANTNGNNDQWLRVDHGNLMRHAIEMSVDPNAVPAVENDPAVPDDLSDMHPNMRQIRNVARIYNMGAGGNENLYLGRRIGAAAEVSDPGSPVTLAVNAVIIDADQEILGLLRVQGDIEALGGNITAYDDPSTVVNEGNIVAENDISTVNGNANINGWIQAQTGDIVAVNGDVRANNGVMHAMRYYDDDPSYYIDSNTTSYMNTIEAYNIRNNSNVHTTLHMRTERLDIRDRSGSNMTLDGRIYLQPGAVHVNKNGTWYDIEDLFGNMTYLGSHVARHGYGYQIYTGQYAPMCSYGNIEVYVDSMSETVQSRSAPTWENNTGSAYRQLARVGRWVTQSGWNFYYYQRNLYDNDQGYGSGYDHKAQALLNFYCRR